MSECCSPNADWSGVALKDHETAMDESQGKLPSSVLNHPQKNPEARLILRVLLREGDPPCGSFQGARAPGGSQPHDLEYAGLPFRGRCKLDVLSTCPTQTRDRRPDPASHLVIARRFVFQKE